jgi:hypothetical protein
MTALQLASHVMKGITRLDLANAPLECTQDLLESLNMTLASWLQMLPPDRLYVPASGTARAPVTQGITITSGSTGFAYLAGSGAYPVGGYASEENAVGATAKVDGAVENNVLLRPGTLLHTYQGATGDKQMTLYGDAVHLPLDTWSIEGEVQLLGLDLDRLGVLRHVPSAPRENALEVGTPREWCMDTLEPLSQESSRRYILRLYPAPHIPFVLKLNTTVYPRAFAIDDLFEPRSLPFRELEASLFMTAAKGDFATSSFRDKAIEADPLVERGQRAMAQLTALMNVPLKGGPCEIMTPAGW